MDTNVVTIINMWLSLGNNGRKKPVLVGRRKCIAVSGVEVKQHVHVRGYKL